MVHFSVEAGVGEGSVKVVLAKSAGDVGVRWNVAPRREISAGSLVIVSMSAELEEGGGYDCG
jgi:hypothetical protein